MVTFIYSGTLLVLGKFSIHCKPSCRVKERTDNFFPIFLTGGGGGHGDRLDFLVAVDDPVKIHQNNYSINN